MLQGTAQELGKNRLSDNSPGRVFVVEKRDQLQNLIDSNAANLQFYVGHAGWTEGQLEHEIADGAWLTLPASVDFVFGENDDMWVEAMRDFGRAFYADVLGVRHFPADPSAN